jgi:hypothetical protein
MELHVLSLHPPAPGQTFPRASACFLC